MSSRVVSLRHKGQITLPADIRDELGLKQGDTLLIEREGKRIIMISVDEIEDPTAGVFRDDRFGRNPDISEEKAWIARHIAGMADRESR